MRKNPALFVLMGIMLINSLSYGIIIPLLYPYAARFGIDAFGLSMLFASFSLAQLLATPIIGRLSDRYGRKPLLLICLLGSSASLALFASAQSAIVLFIARLVDGVTGGNASVAQAVIADSTTGKERTKAFGLLGAAFGFGFLFGPALGGILSEISLSAPFWFSSVLALIGAVAGMVYLKETLNKEDRQPSSEPYFDARRLWRAMSKPAVGTVFLVSLIFTIALNSWIIGFQTFSNDVLRLSTRNIGLLFATFGLISVVMQAFGIRIILNKFKNKSRILLISLVAASLSILPLYFVHSFAPFFMVVLIYGIASSPIGTILSGLVSERSEAEDQGGILGINQSITSFGQIVGPLVGGAIAVYSPNLVFMVAGIIMGTTLLFSKKLLAPVRTKIDL